MNLFPNLQKRYTKEKLSAKEAQRMAEFIAFGPIVFQITRLMVKFGIFEMLRNSTEGLTRQEIAEKAGLTDYAAKVLTDASLTIGTILIDTETDRFTLSKIGWFYLTDPMVRVNSDFNHDVNYLGMFNLEAALTESRPAGLEFLGNWPTIYEGLSSLPADVQKSWFAFDHYYSDCSFEEALKIVFGTRTVKNLLDVGGNTGRWATQCVQHDSQVNVTIMDLPQQIGLMKEATKNVAGADRIEGYPGNLLDKTTKFPTHKQFDAIWMSQFLDCFGLDEIESILSRAAEVMTANTRLYIMETFWDRQKYEPAAFCLTQISVYFTALANGNSKMYHSDDFVKVIEKCGLQIEQIYDQLGQGHTVLVLKKATN